MPLLNNMQGTSAQGFLTPLQIDLLGQALESDGDVSALKFRVMNYQHRDAIDLLERVGWLRREHERYKVSGVVLPFLDTPTARKVLAHIEIVYTALRERYILDQDKKIPVKTLASELAMSPGDVVTALIMMYDISLWCAGRSSELRDEDAFVSPSETILNNESFADLARQVQSWHAATPTPAWSTDLPHSDLSLGFAAAPETHVKGSTLPLETQAEPESEALSAWPAVRACLQEFSFYDIKEIAGLSGLDVTTLSHLVQKSQGGASKGQLMTSIDGQYGKLMHSQRIRFLTLLIEEVLRRRAELEERLSEYLSRLGWAFLGHRLVATTVLRPETLDDTPEASRADLLKAAQRLRDGDLGGVISAACGAVDSATSQVYREFSLGDPADASFQERCKRAAQAKGVLASLDKQLESLGWDKAEVVQFRKNLEGALNQGSYVMQTLRSHMGDVHGSKPILRSLVFDCLRWAELLVGVLVDRTEK